MDLQNVSDIAISTIGFQLDTIVPFGSGKSPQELSVIVNTGVRQLDVESNMDAVTLVKQLEIAMSTNARRRNVVLVFTNGDSIRDIGDHFRSFRTTTHATVVCVGHGLDANFNELLLMTSHPGYAYLLGDELYTGTDVLYSLMSLLEHNTCM